MSLTIFRGSTATLKFTPTNGMSVSDLGTPTVAIVQQLVFLTPDVTVDTDHNCITVTLTEEESLQLVPGVETKVQQAWLLQDGSNIRFPVHKLTVEETLLQSLASEETTEETTEEE